MMKAKLIKASAFTLLIGAIAFIGHVVLRSIVTAGPEPAIFARDPLWMPINALGVIGAVLVLLGLPALFVREVSSAGLATAIGLMLLAAAWMFFGLFLSLYGLLVLPWLADRAPALVAASAELPTPFAITFAVALFGWFVGAVLLGMPFIRHRVQPTWVGYLLLISAVWMIVGNVVVAPSGPASNFAVNLLSNLGPVLLLISLGYLGYRAKSEPRTP